MRRIIHFLVSASVLLSLAGSTLNATIRLSHLVGDNMVLQQNTRANLWGWTDSRKEITVTTSWDSRTYRVSPSVDGSFLVAVETPGASFEHHTIEISQGQEKVTLRDVLVGEVWLATGQSNMEMPIRGFDNCPVEGMQETLLETADYPFINICKIPATESMVPLDDAPCEWRIGTPENVQWTSATAYYFARVLTRVLGVPVGIVEANKGGTRVESWLTRENLGKYTDEDLSEDGIASKWRDYLRPLVWGNGTFNPSINYTVKGIIFYQGCSNVGNPGEQYSDRLALLARQWREQKGEGDIPFYIVEIAPYAGYWEGDEGTQGALLREQQFKASKKIPASGIISTNDCVYPFERYQIHPRQKKKVGQRLAFMALRKTYDIAAFGGLSPEFKDMERGDGFLTLHFENLEGGFSRTADLAGFEVAGEDRVFHPARTSEAPGDWKSLKVWSDEVEKPVAVRYCFRNFLLGNCSNAMGFPLIPFRSDDWDL